MLQQDARDTSTEIIGKYAGVTAPIVRNRINRMESSNVIRGYYPDSNYDAAGYSFHYRFLCSAPTVNATNW